MRIQPDEVCEVIFEDGSVGFYTSADEQFLAEDLQQYRSMRVIKKEEITPPKNIREQHLQEAYAELDEIEREELDEGDDSSTE